MRLRLLFLVVLSGCRTPPFEPVHFMADSGAPASVDAAARCVGLHDRIDVPLTRLELIDYSPFEGAAVRARIGFPWRPDCDVLGGVDAQPQFDGGADLVIIAHLWRSTDGACSGTAEATEIIVLSDAVPIAGAFKVADGAPGGTLSLGLKVAGAPPGGDCAAVPLDGRCVRDCQCSAALATARCLPIKLGAERLMGVCAIPCDEDAACPDGPTPVCGKVSVAPSYSCVAGSCQGDGDCRFGQRCQSVGASRACRPPSQLPQLPTSCRCSAECGLGAVCTIVGEDALGCVLPCAIDGDCPAHGACGDRCVKGRCMPTPCG